MLDHGCLKFRLSDQFCSYSMLGSQQHAELSSHAQISKCAKIIEEQVSSELDNCNQKGSLQADNTRLHIKPL